MVAKERKEAPKKESPKGMSVVEKDKATHMNPE